MRFSFAPSRTAHVEIKCQGMQCGIIEAAHMEDAIRLPTHLLLGSDGIQYAAQAEAARDGEQF